MSQEKSGEMKKLSSTASTVLEEEFDENYEPTEEGTNTRFGLVNDENFL